MKQHQHRHVIMFKFDCSIVNNEVEPSHHHHHFLSHFILVDYFCMLPSVQTEMFWCAWNCSSLHHFSSSVEDMEASEPSGHSWKEVGVGGWRGSWGKSDPDNDQSPENLCLAARRAHLHIIQLWSAWQRLLWGKCLQDEAKQEWGAWNPNKVLKK